MKLAITGASGLIGSALAAHWRAAGHEVLRFVRRGVVEAGAGDAVRWEPESGKVEVAKLAGVNVVVHLAGESISGLWTKEKKRRILESRVRGTRTLCDALAGMEQTPKTLLAASAIGFYGSRGEEVLTEESPAGEGFLAGVCGEWENQTRTAAERGIRVVNMRLGIVLSREGGALRQMLTPFKLGLGGRVGDGRQWMSWVALGDVVGAFDAAAQDAGLVGAVNVTAPNPVPNLEFTHALARALGRPAIVPVPGFAVKTLLGEMGRELLLSSARVLPAKLEAAGFRFRHERIGEAMGAVLKG